jgi:hypothetical protein
MYASSSVESYLFHVTYAIFENKWRMAFVLHAMLGLGADYGSKVTGNHRTWIISFTRRTETNAQYLMNLINIKIASGMN